MFHVKRPHYRVRLRLPGSTTDRRPTSVTYPAAVAAKAGAPMCTVIRLPRAYGWSVGCSSPCLSHGDAGPAAVGLGYSLCVPPVRGKSGWTCPNPAGGRARTAECRRTPEPSRRVSAAQRRSRCPGCGEQWDRHRLTRFPVTSGRLELPRPGASSWCAGSSMSTPLSRFSHGDSVSAR